MFGCGTSVNVDYQPGTDFSVLKSFQVEEKPVTMPDDTRVNSPFILKRISEALKNHLILKGMSPSKDKPDVIAKYHLGIKQELESDASGLSVGIGSATSHSAIGFVYGIPASEVATNENLMITIDVVKSTTKALLWRGSYTSRLEAGSTPESSTEQINAMVKAILDKFPPK